jgi:membrane associated rhomboid family serine protease
VDVPPAPDADGGANANAGANADGGTNAPMCYRHGDRETYLSCVRCGRPACPDCLRAAPVGQQCVDCVREGNRNVRQPAAVFGGRMVAGAVVTWVLVALNVVGYLAELVYPRTVDDLAMVASLNNGTIGVAHGQAYRLITSAFIHNPGLGGIGPAHIIFNMWALILVGPALERLLGHLRFAGLYLLSALGGSVLFYLLAPAGELALGASGAIFGLFGAYFVVSRRLRVDTRGIVILIILNLVISFVFSSAIAWQAHVGGLVTGSLIAAAYAYAPRHRRALVQGGATVAVLAVLIIAVLSRNSQLAVSALG